MDAANSSRLQSHSDSGNLAEARLRMLVEENPGNFDAWTLLIKEIEKTSPNDTERIFNVYDAFLSEFPLCYGYWRKYADHRARLCNIDKVVEVFERAVQSATYSVGLWVNYCSFGMLSFEDPVDIQRLFERALSFVGKDYLCHHLWDKYIEFEYSQKQWSHLAHIYLRSLRFPTKKLHMYYKSFERLISMLEEEMKYQDGDAAEVSSEVLPNCGITDVKAFKDQDISSIIEDLLAPSADLSIPNALKKYLSAGEYFYQKASELDSKIKCFENHIRRPYFHMKPLDDDQLENWHHYLDFVEMQGDFDWTVKLYERCLIPCASYPEFWIRYVEFVEAKGGREIANLALFRATEVYLKRVPGIHLFCARFKEQIGDISGARAAFLQCGSDLEPKFIENVIRKANMEKRQGNVEAALIIYEKALVVAKEMRNYDTLGILYAQFSNFTYMATARIDAARDILIKGIQYLPQCKLLLERLIHFEMMHGGPRKVDALDSIIAEATAPVTDAFQGLSTNDREDISKLFLEFVDLCGSIHEIKKAWDRHRKLFPYQMRPAFSYHDMTSRNGYADNTVTGGNDNPATLPHQAFRDKHTQRSAHHSVFKDTSPQKNTDTQSNLAVTDQFKLEKTDDNQKEGLPQLQTTIAVQEGPKSDAAEQHIGVCDAVHEDSNCAQAIQAEENAEVSEQVQMKPDHKPHEDLIPPALETLSINAQEDEFEQSSPILSVDCRTSDASTSNESEPLDGGTTGEVTIPNSMCMQSETSPRRNIQEQNDHVIGSDPESEKKMPMPTETDSQQMMRIIVDSGNSHQMNYTRQDQRDHRPHEYAEPRKRQQRHAAQRSQNPTPGMLPPVLTSQGYPHQPQVWQNQQVQQANLAPNQYQVGTGPVYPTSNVWPAQNVQTQAFASVSQGQTSTQPVSHPRPQVYQHPYQNTQQFLHVQSNQGYNPQMWDYYQQHEQQLQQYHLQLQQQQQQVQQHQPPQQQLHLQQLQLQQQQVQQHQQQQVQQHQPPQQQQHLQQQQYHLQQQQPQLVQQLPLQQQPQQQLLQQQQYHQQQQQQQLPQQQQPPQQLHPQQQQPPQQQHQYHLQQQHQIQMWSYNYYSQALPVQYYEGSQYGQEYGQQVIGSQVQVASQHDVEQSSNGDPSQ